MKRRYVKMLSLVVISQLHLFENEAADFFGNIKSIVRSQNHCQPLFMPIGIIECAASPSCIE